jgi:glycosyltransferase involved in cell wall biosynthesis
MYGHAWGASEMLWSDTAERLAHDGHRVDASVAHWPRQRPALAKLSNAGVGVWERPPSLVPLWLKALQKAGAGVPDDMLRKPLRKWLASTRADLVCVSNGDVASGADWLAVCERLGLRYVNVAQANHEQFWVPDEGAAELRRVFSAACKCFFVSEGNLKLFEKQIAQRLTNAEIVRNPYKVPWDVDCPWNAEPEIWNLACIGRLEPYPKGQDLLIEVLARPEWRERPLSVSIYGEGAWAQTLERLAALHGISDRVRFCGYVDDIRAVWATHHALVVPSRFEGLPLVVVEAMLCSRPVIATDVAGHGELIDDGITGFLAEAPTVPLLAAAMERAWNRRGEWRTMGEAASRRVRERVPRDPPGTFASRLVALAAQG